MKRLHDKVNIIPLIAKADTLTPEECRDFKKTVSDYARQRAIRLGPGSWLGSAISANNSLLGHLWVTDVIDGYALIPLFLLFCRLVSNQSLSFWLMM